MKFITKYKYEIIVLVFYVISRLPSLGHDYFNTDVWKWKTRSYDFSSGIFSLNFAQTNQKYHPGVTLMWVGTFSIKVFNLYSDVFTQGMCAEDFLCSVFGLHFTQKLVLSFFIGISLSFIFYALKNLFGSKYAAICIFLITLEPFYVALTRVFHLEGMLATFMFGSAVWFYLYLKYQKKKVYLLVSAIFGSLAFLTKTSALYLLPFIILTSFLQSVEMAKKNLKKSLFFSAHVFIKWLLVFMLGIFILWPALWVDFSYVVMNLYRGISEIGVEGDHGQFYFGKYVENPGILYYIVVLGLRSSLFLLIGSIGYLFCCKNKEQKEKNYFVLYWVIYSIFYIVQHTIPAKKLDRYILPALIGLVPIAAFFFEQVFESVKAFSRRKIVLLTFILFPVLTLIYLHPDYLSYYNPVFGGLKTGIYVLEPKWMIGREEIIDYFKKLAVDRNISGYPDCPSYECVIEEDKKDEVLSVGFPEKYYTQIHPFIREIGGWAVIKDMTPFAKNTMFFVYPVWDDDSNMEDRFKLNYLGTIKVRGVDVYNVYESY